MKHALNRRHALSLIAAALAAPTLARAAEKKYGPGVTDTEVKIGQTSAYSGPAAAYGLISTAQMAYYKMINDQGGINGRKINLISLDDGFSPPKTVEQTRRLVESENVLAIVGPLGTATSMATRKYLNAKKVPQIFIKSGTTTFSEGGEYPWTTGWEASYQTEGRAYAKYILDKAKDAKVGVLYENIDSAKDMYKGLRDGLGDKADTLIVKAVTYDINDPTVDSQIVALQASGANVFVNISSPKAAAQGIQKAKAIGWKPQLHLLSSSSSSIDSVFKPAGFDAATGIITVAFMKDPTDKQWANDKGYLDYVAFMKKYLPEGSPSDSFYVYGYSLAQTFVQVLRQCGDDLTRENLMKQTLAIKDLELPMLIPGVKINTSPTDFAPIEQIQLRQFNGSSYVAVSGIIGK